MTQTLPAPLSLPTAAAQADRIIAAIAAELSVRPAQVRAAVTLMDDGASVPFIARYRKEATGTLDDAQLRDLEERLRYLRELEARRVVVLETIHGLGKLTAELRRAVEAATTKSELEDLYLPYKSTRKTKADAAREAGLEPLLDALLSDPSRFPAVEADSFVDAGRGVATADEALAGARAILIERAGQDAVLVGELRERLWKKGRLRSAVKSGKDAEGEKFKDYFDFAQPPHTLPSPRTRCRATASWRCCAGKRKVCSAWIFPRPIPATPMRRPRPAPATKTRWPTHWASQNPAAPPIPGS